MPARPPRPLIVAHRGASHDAPENTLAAFRLGFEQGAAALEGDFRLTADRQVVCVHDATTRRCGDRALSVARSTFAELRTADVGAWKSKAFAGERVPTLAEVLATVPKGKRAFLELKTGPSIVPYVRDVIRAGPVPPGRLLLMSFNAATTAACRALIPEVALDWLVSFRRTRATGRLTPTPTEVVATARRCGAGGVGVQARPDALTAAFVRKMTHAGLAVHAWTVDDVAAARAYAALGVTAITTNRPAEMAGIEA